MGWLKIRMPNGGWRSVSKNGAGPEAGAQLKVRLDDGTWARHVDPSEATARPLHLRGKDGRWANALSMTERPLGKLSRIVVFDFGNDHHRLWIGPPPALMTITHDECDPVRIYNATAGHYVVMPEGTYPTVDGPFNAREVVDANRAVDSAWMEASSYRYWSNGGSYGGLPRYDVSEGYTRIFNTGHVVVDFDLVRRLLPTDVGTIDGAKIQFIGFAIADNYGHRPPAAYKYHWYLHETTGQIPVYLQSSGETPPRLVRVARSVGENMSMHPRQLDAVQGTLLASGPVDDPQFKVTPWETIRYTRDMSAEEFSSVDHLDFMFSLDHLEAPDPPKVNEYGYAEEYEITGQIDYLAVEVYYH